MDKKLNYDHLKRKKSAVKIRFCEELYRRPWVTVLLCPLKLKK